MRSKGYRRGTRHRFSKKFRQHGAPKPSIHTNAYRKGQFVEIYVDSSVQKGMPHKFYHGRTGKVFNVDPRSVGVLMQRQHGPRFYEKRITARIEHVRPSRCNEDFVARRAENDRIRREAAERGEKAGPLKRVPRGPRAEIFLSAKDNAPCVVKNRAFVEIY